MNTQPALHNMIKQQLRTGDVLNESILSLYEEIPREAFVPEEMKAFAYSDLQIPLPYDQRMMNPLEEGRILQALQLTGNEVVLEVGTGTGFLTALLSRLSREVISLDYYEAFTNKARGLLQDFKCTNVTCITGDAYQGWVDKAPYDVIVFTGALSALTDIQRLQLLPGGRIIALIGQAPLLEAQLHTLDHEGNWSCKILFETLLPPLIHKLSQQQFVF